MLFREVTSGYIKDHTLQINKRCGQNVESLVLNKTVKHFLKCYQISIYFSFSMQRFIL